MPSDSLKAEAGALAQAAKYTSSAREDLTSQAQTLYSNVSGQEHGWKGQGGTSFFNLQEAWFEKQKRVVAILEHFENSLHSTDRDNVSTDETQSQATGKLHDRLG